MALSASEAVTKIRKSYDPFSVHLDFDVETELWEVWVRKLENGDEHFLAAAADIEAALRRAAKTKPRRSYLSES